MTAELAGVTEDWWFVPTAFGSLSLDAVATLDAVFHLIARADEQMLWSDGEIVLYRPDGSVLQRMDRRPSKES